MKGRDIIVSVLMLLVATAAEAQITIGGNVYGGGNAGNTGGSTKVTVHAGNLNNVFGGARKADVSGSAFVNIDGQHASGNIFINNVYGGNDIAGTVGNAATVPSELTEIGTGAGKNNINDSWNAFVRTSPTPETTIPADRFSLVIGSLFGGGNGDYDYTSGDYVDLVKPELGKTYLEILGGCIAHLYGGGNNVTVTGNTTICINNESPVLTETNVWPATPDPTDAAAVAEYKTKLAKLAERTGLSTYQSDLSSYAFNFSRVFGGNNKAPMAIRPKWNLQAGVIRDLYSGGNQGAMTHEKGILLHVNPLESDKLMIENVFGGCRIADVNPDKNIIGEEVIDGTTYPAGYAARVLIEGGDIQTVYGGNDISGTIYGGNAVGIHSSIKGDVYGGGNGSYAYTDNATLGAMEDFKDFYYNPGSSSVDALNAYRPNAEAVSIRVVGTETKKTVIGGAIYCGGNSASLRNEDPTKNATSQLKIGSYVIADKVFLGNNGANMVTEDILTQYAGSLTVGSTSYDFSEMDLASETKDANGQTQFDKYMDGCAMMIEPDVTFDPDYKPYTTYFGSFYCGGNVGSMKIDGAMEVSFNDKVVVFNKVVGGSNEANVYEKYIGEEESRTKLNAQYLGGLLGDPAPAPAGSPEGAIGNKLILNFGGLKIEPKRWVDPADKSLGLVWNTVSASTGSNVDPITSGFGSSNADDLDRRLKGGNIYGGCYSNGHVNGNVVINLNETLHERDKLFDITTNEGDKNYENVEKAEEDPTYYSISQRNTGVILSQQGTDCFASALNVFGGGYGGDSEIWGSTTINLNKGYTFQIYGGGEEGAIGKADPSESSTLTYQYNNNYSTYINLNGDASLPGVAKNATGDSPDMAECEYLYGGAFEGKIAGNTHVYLGNGRIFNSFGGSCNADILGHVETYIGSTGFPYVRDYVYGGNDLGGKILNDQSGIDAGDANFTGRIRGDVVGMVDSHYYEQVQKIAAYTEYTQGRADYILGGGSGNYDYSDDLYSGIIKPYIHNTFVNFRPTANESSMVNKVFGAGEGNAGDRDGDELQDHSYVLIDIPDGIDNFASTEVFGAGAYNGLGMRYAPAETFDSEFDLNEASAIIDLMRGKIKATYGGSYEEGVTRRTMVNVPVGSSINITNIFGGAFGTLILPPCDVYESNVNYHSNDATVTGAIYGGNNSERRTLYAHVNISSPVWSNKAKGYTAKVYGAGKGKDTWSEYTEVNLLPKPEGVTGDYTGAKVKEVYGGGELGHVLNGESVMKYMQTYKELEKPSDDIIAKNPKWKKPEKWTDGVVGSTLKDADTVAEWLEDWRKAWTFGDYYVSRGEYTLYASNEYMNLSNSHEVRTAEVDDRDHSGLTEEQKARIDYKYNTNVIIHSGATVEEYAYGGGLGAKGTPLSGDVYGTTYVALLGGTVGKDIYAAGTTGAVYNLFGAENCTTSTNAYIKGGTVRNVYGGGWEGDVGYHSGKVSDPKTGDIEGETHVVVGVKGDDGFLTGNPAILRNVYGGGEGGSVYGDAHITVYNGHIGYSYSGTAYVEELDDEVEGDNLLDESGNVFGGGYVANSYTDNSYITMYGGTVRGCLYGGGEIGPIGRGTALQDASTANSEMVHRDPADNSIIGIVYKGGEAHVTMYGGLVMRNVFGGGRGYDNWNGYGTKFMKPEVIATLDLSSKGYIFGSTEVRIRGGVVGTTENVIKGHGNVFGGGNVGYVFSAKGKKRGTHGTALVNGLPEDGGGYYYSKWLGDAGVGSDRTKCELSLDCNVVVEPYCLVTDAGGITIGSNSYAQGQYVPIEDLNKLRDKNTDAEKWAKIDWESGVTIRNAVFAGGNVTIGGDQVYVNTGTVFGNVTAALRDAYNRDLITIGTEHTGGLYGDGNLTLVDGYRELHIDNYGTDYYSTDQEISKETYNSMSDRERAYFVLNYKAKNDITVTGTLNGKTTTITISKDERMSSDKFKETFGYDFYNTDGYPAEFKAYINADGTPNPTYFNELGFCSLYAGRLLNTIQRCDMAAVYGSRIVLQGARDRVPQKADYTRYTLNRVGELSLNQRVSEATDEAPGNLKHGNYFGIYSVVHYLGNLTSDVFFDDVRVANTSNEADKADGTTTYYQWKEAHVNMGNRNNGTCPNKVSLASGVYLEIIREETEAIRKQDGMEDYTEWGLITGVVELDLIDVRTGLGGGYVYARNEHGVKTHHEDWNKVNLSPYNLNARTYKRFTYDTSESTMKEFETSGNFIHFTKQIIDDCYPNANAYKGADKSPAHYWYIKGSIYVYDQIISAYTGSANAYAETVSIPLTISASSHGKLTLRDVQTNLYAYYGEDGQPLGENSIIVNGITYEAGDPIDYWSYQMLSITDQGRFVPEVYTTIAACTITTNSGTTTYRKGHVMLPGDEENPAVGTYNYIKQQAPTKQKKELDPNDDDTTLVPYVHDTAEDKDVAFDFVFRPANNLTHDSGFVLTYDMNNPGVWDDYYTLINTGDPVTVTIDEELYTYPRIITKEIYGELTDAQKAKYIIGPTYKAIADGVFGQKKYSQGEIITKGVVDDYPASHLTGRTDQARVERAYVVTTELTVTNVNGKEQNLSPGAPVYQSDYTAAVWSGMTDKVSVAKVCTSTLMVSETDYVYAGNLLSTAQYETLRAKIITKNGYTGTDSEKQAKADTFLSEYLDDAYYVTDGGLYGGSWYEANKSYLAIDAWCSMSETDRNNFRYNYDGIDLLIDGTYGTYGNRVGYNGDDYGFKPQYDGYAPGTTKGQINIAAVAADPATALGNLAQYNGSSPINPINYSATTPIDFEAEFNPSSEHKTVLGNHFYADQDDPDDTSKQKLIYRDRDGNPQEIKVGYDNRVTSTRFEEIPNERVHWSCITFEEPGDYYVVKESFIKGEIPYTVGQTIDEKFYNSLTDAQKAQYIATVDLSGIPEIKDENDKTVKQYFYYCREPYTINEKGEGEGIKRLDNTSGTDDYGIGATVPLGTIINEEEYTSLKNLQTGFIIHGTAPTETATLYVSRESDYYNLTKDRIITVIYEYEYQESDESGNNITPVSERHIVNIHLKFESGAPQIGLLATPNIVLPGSTIALALPSREVGAFEITSSGWEMYTNEEDAKLHVNGQPYVNNETPMYWYQNGYWVAYYAQTYLGKTFSNAVQFSVANYHDLKKVMDAKEHHYYIDHKDVDRAPKIYIEDYSEDDVNGLDLLKNLVDLSYVDKTYDISGNPVAISGGTFDGHIPMEDRVRGVKGLDFILHSNLEHTVTWNPIAGKNGSGVYDKCFEGNFHGDGHYIKGLDHSLFGKLCGNVYNTGVMGSFTSAGIADTGEGFVENCWTMSSATTMDSGVRGVFGNPSDVSDKDGKQIINCYYLDKNAYNTEEVFPSHPRGLARPMKAKAFYNGTVAYNLNGFYLKKRYYDGTNQSTGLQYQYYQPADLDAVTKTYHESWYPADYAYYPLEATTDKKLYGYVENRFADGDFIYQNDEIPETSDIRLYTDPTTGKPSYFPIWPDDYLFFGQRLNYDYYDVTGDETEEELAEKMHQEVPSPVIRDDEEGERVLMTKLGNRVYRAPAYFRNGLMDVAHFNPYAIFAQTKKNDADILAYKGMTAIDFTGGNGDWSGGYKWDWTAGASAAAPERFFAPLLDDGGLTGFVNVDLTKNLLVYTGTTTPAMPATNTKVSNYLWNADPYREPVYGELDTTEKPAKYRAVAALGDAVKNIIKGHHVVQDGTGYKAVTDHFLVDKEDFNAPISYTFDSSHRMWYQRTPDEIEDLYVSVEWSNEETPKRSTKGWEGVSLPFTAELVTTQQKGEITHFYNNSWESKNEPSTHSKIGHEYWLRGFTGIGNTSGQVVTANFNPPSNGTDGVDKSFTNTFLWDYYYSYNGYDDGNGDDYQEDDAVHTYYKNARTHEAYAYLTKATPYIIGFPSDYYYEFDLSGKFSPKNTASWPKSRDLGKQTISFVSSPGTTIAVSDGEKVGIKPGGSDYTFKPTYLNNPELETGKHAFLLNSDGNSYVEDNATESANVKAFRPYFTATASGAREVTRSIIFSNDDSQLKGVEERGNPSEGTGSLSIYAKKHKIVVESALNYTTDVRIVNTAGITVKSFSIEPGETVETRIYNAGVYIVQTADARYTKKLAVK